MMNYFQKIPANFYLYFLGAILLLGIILGFSKKIIVYRDYSDLTKVFFIAFVPIGIGYLVFNQIGLMLGITKELYRNSIFLIESLLMIWIVYTTYKDNRSILKTLLALITKIPLAVIFAILLVNFFFPTEKNRMQRSKNSGLLAIFMIILSLILYGLVDEKVWNKNKKK